MPYFLVSLDERMRFSLSGPEEVYLVGRSEDCDIRLESRKVSRRHCCIAQVNDYLAVRDLASANGIRINGREVFEGRLSHGDTLIVGPYSFRVIWQPETAGPSGASRTQSEARLAERERVSPASAPKTALDTAAQAPLASAPPRRQAPAPPPSKPGSLLEDSRLFKLLESDDPLLGGGR